MLTELYIDALLADEAMADQVWELWDAVLIGDEFAANASWAIPMSPFPNSGRSDHQ